MAKIVQLHRADTTPGSANPSDALPEKSVCDPSPGLSIDFDQLAEASGLSEDTLLERMAQILSRDEESPGDAG